MDNHYLFIDGGCVRSTFEHYCRTYFEDASLEMNIAAVVSGYQKAFYYDSLPPKKADESDSDYELRIAPLEALFESLAEVNGLHVHLGTTRIRRKMVEQKQVDIMIAVHMMSHCHRRNMARATLLTSDLDFKPLIDALVQDGLHVTLWYPRYKTSRELIKSADARRRFDVQTAYAMLKERDQARFRNPNGEIRRGSAPPDWKPRESWHCRRHGEVCLYDAPVGYGLQFRDLANAGYSVFLTFDDLRRFRLYASDAYDLDWPAT